MYTTGIQLLPPVNSTYHPLCSPLSEHCPSQFSPSLYWHLPNPSSIQGLYLPLHPLVHCTRSCPSSSPSKCLNLPHSPSPCCYHSPNKSSGPCTGITRQGCLTHDPAAKSRPTLPVSLDEPSGFLLFSRRAKLPITLLILSPTPCKAWQTPWHRAEFKSTS